MCKTHQKRFSVNRLTSTRLSLSVLEPHSSKCLRYHYEQGKLYARPNFDYFFMNAKKLVNLTLNILVAAENRDPLLDW